MYRSQRNYENLTRAIFGGVGRFGIPEIKPVYDVGVDNWISYNYAATCEEPEIHGVHFFIDDYQFLRLWAAPDTYMPRLSRFQAVCSPDFSTYTDFPSAVQIYNHYRKHWLGAYWQGHGIKVIPTISWSDKDSFEWCFEWCFDGEPRGGVVAVSSVGTQKNTESRTLFMEGYNEMLNRLNPCKIVFYGDVPSGCGGDIIRVEAFQNRLRGRAVK